MIMKIEKLRGNEIKVFKEMLSKYHGYDSIDLLIHKTLKSLGVSKNEFEQRKVFKENKKLLNVVRQEADEYNKFCDGDACEISFLDKKC